MAVIVVDTRQWPRSGRHAVPGQTELQHTANTERGTATQTKPKEVLCRMPTTSTASLEPVHHVSARWTYRSA